jgi:periplasmic divalent cation tolerance protein
MSRWSSSFREHLPRGHAVRSSLPTAARRSPPDAPKSLFKRNEVPERQQKLPVSWNGEVTGGFAMTDAMVVLITAPNENDAEAIAKALLEARLAACVNIIRNIRSLYRWQGKVEDEQEVLMIVKTRKERFGELVKKVRGLHSYTVPEIIALPVTDGLEEYLGWIGQETEK